MNHKMRTTAVFAVVLAAASLCAANERSSDPFDRLAIDPPRTEYPRPDERYLEPIDSSDPDHLVYLMIDPPKPEERPEDRYLEPVDSSDPDHPVYLMIDPPKPAQKRSVDVNPPPLYDYRSVIKKRSAAGFDYSYSYDNPRHQVDA